LVKNIIKEIIMIKKCKYCNNDFEKIGNKGSEQLYCSTFCHIKTGVDRYKNNLINKFKQDELSKFNANGVKIEGNGKENDFIKEEKETKVFNEIAGVGNLSQGFQSNASQQISSGLSNNSFYGSFENYIRLIQDNATMTSEIKRLNEKIHNLEVEVGTLTSELDSYEEEEEEESSSGMLGNIVASYKQDPLSTINFAKDMFYELLKKPKNDNQAKKTA